MGRTDTTPVQQNWPEEEPGDPLDAPLLSQYAELRHSEQTPLKSNFWECVVNLTKVILGAGIMALPRAVALLGWVAGMSLLLLVGLLTHFTVHGLVYASDRCRCDTYSSLVRKALGRVPERVLQAVMLLGCLGFEVVYLDIVGDLLVGEAPSYDGLITAWLDPQDRQQWYVRRPFVLALLTACLLAPLSSLRTMGHLGAVNLVGLASLAAFAGTTVWLGAAAAAGGTAHALPAGPDLAGLGSDTASRLTAALAVVPVVLTAASCHQSVHPLRTMMAPYDAAALDRVVATSLTIVTVLFAVVCLAGYSAFGPDVRGNFLNNLAPPQLAPLIGRTAAAVVSYGVRGGYAVSLVGSAVLIMFPLRQSLLEMVAPAKAGPGPAPTSLYLASTYGLLCTVYGIAVYIPSIWDVISFVGAVACTIMCFIIPAALIIKFKDDRSISHRLQRMAAWAVGALGVALFANVFLGPLLAAGASRPAPPPSPEAYGAGALCAEAVGGGRGCEGVWAVWRWAGWGA